MFEQAAPMLESTVLHCYTCGREQSSFSSSFNFISVPSSPVSHFLLLQCQFYLSSFCSKCQRVQCSGAPHIAETGVLSPPVSILLEFLLLQSQFYQSSFFSGLNFITVPSSPLSILLESLLLQVSESTVLCCSTHSKDWSSFLMKCAKAVKPYSHWTGTDRQD